MAKQPTRQEQYKNMYNFARLCLPEQYRSDKEAVKAKRDQVCADIFGKAYNELSDEELTNCIELLKRHANVKTEATTKSTSGQRRLLWVNAIKVALHYTAFDNYSYSAGNRIISGEELRGYMKEAFYNDRLPKEFASRLLNDYVNPLCRTYLEQGGYTELPNTLYWKSLSTHQIQYLINRFTNIANNLRN